MPDFQPNTHFVLAKKVDPRGGQFTDGYHDYEHAKAEAERLAQDTAYQDVVLITEIERVALVRVFKGVQWFCEDYLHRKYADAWTLIESEPPPEILAFQQPPVSETSSNTPDVAAG